MCLIFHFIDFLFHVGFVTPLVIVTVNMELYGWAPFLDILIKQTHIQTAGPACLWHPQKKLLHPTRSSEVISPTTSSNTLGMKTSMKLQRAFKEKLMRTPKTYCSGKERKNPLWTMQLLPTSRSRIHGVKLVSDYVEVRVAQIPEHRLGTCPLAALNVITFAYI